MRFASGLFVAVALLLVASVAVTSFRHRGTAAAGAAPRSILVSQGDAAAVRRLVDKNIVTHRLLDGDLTLPEAAAWFRAVDRATGAPAYVPLPGEENETEGERLCRQVIRWADSAARETSADLSATVVRRLETELDERVRRDGVELPELP